MLLFRSGMIVRDTYAWASPYGNADPEKLYGRHLRSLYGKQLWKAADLEARLTGQEEWPEMFLLGNFCPDGTAFKALCRQRGINFAHWEDGFFPHYETQHLDPSGFCWESSLTRMVFRGCSDRQRDRARTARAAWLNRPVMDPPTEVRKPFVLWPLQLIGDQVNRRDVNVREWTGLLRHFRETLPMEFQLVIKAHPRGAAMDVEGVEQLVRELPGLVFVPRHVNLAGLLRECRGVAGANSSVLHEARLMYHKPAYAYGRSWFTHHPDLVTPLSLADGKGRASEMPHVDWLENSGLLRTEYLEDYADWFLAQLLARQIDRRDCTTPAATRAAIWRLSDRSFGEYGEAIFEV